MRRVVAAIAVASSLMLGLTHPLLAQDIDVEGDNPDLWDSRPPPPPPAYRFGDIEGPGYLPHASAGRGGRRRLVCRTEVGACLSRAPQSYRARCACDFGAGRVPGRMRP